MIKGKQTLHTTMAHLVYAAAFATEFKASGNYVRAEQWARSTMNAYTRADNEGMVTESCSDLVAKRDDK